MYIDILQILAFLKLILFSLGIVVLWYFVMVLREVLKFAKKVNNVSQRIESVSEELGEATTKLFSELWVKFKNKYLSENQSKNNS